MRLFIIFIFLASTISAQTDGVFYFAVTDGSGNKILPSHYWKVSAAIQDADTIALDYLIDDTAYLIGLPENSFGKMIQVQLAYTAGTYTGIMNVYFKAAGKNGNGSCHTCAITDMVYNPGNFLLDLPYQEISWEYLENFSLKREGKISSLKNVSMLQNWSEPNLK